MRRTDSRDFLELAISRHILPTSWSVCFTPAMLGCAESRRMRSLSMTIPEVTPGYE